MGEELAKAEKRQQNAAIQEKHQIGSTSEVRWSDVLESLHKVSFIRRGVSVSRTLCSSTHPPLKS